MAVGVRGTVGAHAVSDYGATPRKSQGQCSQKQVCSRVVLGHPSRFNAAFRAGECSDPIPCDPVCARARGTRGTGVVAPITRWCTVPLVSMEQSLPTIYGFDFKTHPDWPLDDFIAYLGSRHMEPLTIARRDGDREKLLWIADYASAGSRVKRPRSRSLWAGLIFVVDPHEAKAHALRDANGGFVGLAKGAPPTPVPGQPPPTPGVLSFFLVDKALMKGVFVSEPHGVSVTGLTLLLSSQYAAFKRSRANGKTDLQLRAAGTGFAAKPLGNTTAIAEAVRNGRNKEVVMTYRLPGRGWDGAEQVRVVAKLTGDGSEGMFRNILKRIEHLFGHELSDEDPTDQLIAEASAHGRIRIRQHDQATQKLIPVTKDGLDVLSSFGEISVADYDIYMQSTSLSQQLGNSPFYRRLEAAMYEYDDFNHP